MHNPYMTTGVDSAAPPAQENMPYEGSWIDYPQSTMAGFSSPEFAYMPPMATHDLSPHVSPHDVPSQPHNMLHNDIDRMPPPLQPRHSPTVKQENVDVSPKQEQQQNHQPTSEQQQQQQHPPLSMPSLAMTHQSPHQNLPQLPMLTTMPSWPSMLTNPGQYTQPHSIHIVPRTGPQPPAPPPLKTKLSEREGRPNPRKMLTDDDRRKMCEYAEAHPGIKQSEIGAHFGVERSTVSKVLRNKDKYKKDDRSKSPGGKKGKGGKFPDIERALSNWVRNTQRTGLDVTDADIREKLRFFAGNTGNPDPILKASTTSWLEKFKQKNGIGASGRLVRRASETNIPKRKSSINSMSSMGSMNQRVVQSPLSPIARHASTSPTSANRSDEERDTLSADPSSLGQHFMGHSGHLSATGLGGSMAMGIGISGMGYKDSAGNQSSASLTSVYADTPVSSFSSSAPYTFSPDPNVGSFLDTDPMAHTGSASFQRPRSQTLPALNMDYMSQPQQLHQQQQQHDQQHHDQQQQQQQQQQHHGQGGSASGDAMTPKYLHHHHMSSTAPSSAVDSPMTDVSGPSYGLDSAVVSPQLRRSGSSSSLFQANPRSAGGLGGATILGSPLSANGSSTNLNANGGASTLNTLSTPSSPTQDDARRAADTLLTFIKMGPSGFDQSDLLAMARMVEKLRLQQTPSKSHHGLGLSLSHSHTSHSHGHTHGGMGGLSQIPEGEGEMGHDMAAHVKAETIAA